MCCLYFLLWLLRSESPSGMCAKLDTVAASNNRVHPTRPLYYSLFALHIYGFGLRAHSIRGEPRIQRNANWEVATKRIIKMLMVFFYIYKGITSRFFQVLSILWKYFSSNARRHRNISNKGNESGDHVAQNQELCRKLVQVCHLTCGSWNLTVS